jgi:hypothetical protein
MPRQTEIRIPLLAAPRRNRKGAYRFLGVLVDDAEVREAGVVIETGLAVEVCEELGVTGLLVLLTVYFDRISLRG